MIVIIGTTHLYDHEALRFGSDHMSSRTFVVRTEAAPGSTGRLPIDDHTYGGELRLETDLSYRVSDDEQDIRLLGECRLFEGAFETTSDEEGRFAIAQDLMPGFATPFSQKLRSAGRRGGDFGQLSFLAVHDFETVSFRRGGRTIPRDPADDTARLIATRAQLTHKPSSTTFRYAFAGSTRVSRDEVATMEYDRREEPPYPPIEPAFHLRAIQLRAGQIGVVVDFENLDSLGDDHGERLASDTAMAVVGTGDHWQNRLVRTYSRGVYRQPLSYTVELFSTFPI